MSSLSLFFQSGLSDQLAVAGTLCVLKNPGGVPVPFKGVLTENNAQLEAMPGLMEHTVSAHVLIPADISTAPEPAAVISANGKMYLVTNVVKSPYSSAYACELQAQTK